MAEGLRRGLQILLSQFDSGRGLQMEIGGMNKEILKIALNTENLSFLENHTHSTKLKNSTCGDEIKIYLIVKNKTTNFLWRPRPESNWDKRICNPLRNHSATWPHLD